MPLPSAASPTFHPHNPGTRTRTPTRDVTPTDEPPQSPTSPCGAGDGEPTVDVELFLARLTQAAHTAKPKSELERRHLEQVAGWIQQRTTDAGTSLSRIFREWDGDGDGYISYDEFVACCMTCQASSKGGVPASGTSPEGPTAELTEEDFTEVAKAIDTGATSGRISYLAFLSVLQVLPGSDVQRAARDANRTLIDFICSVLWANEVTLSKAFRLFDPKQTGLLAPAGRHVVVTWSSRSCHVAVTWPPPGRRVAVT